MIHDDRISDEGADGPDPGIRESALTRPFKSSFGTSLNLGLGHSRNTTSGLGGLDQQNSSSIFLKVNDEKLELERLHNLSVRVSSQTKNLTTCYKNTFNATLISGNKSCLSGDNGRLPSTNAHQKSGLVTTDPFTTQGNLRVYFNSSGGEDGVIVRGSQSKVCLDQSLSSTDVKKITAAVTSPDQ